MAGRGLCILILKLTVEMPSLNELTYEYMADGFWKNFLAARMSRNLSLQKNFHYPGPPQKNYPYQIHFLMVPYQFA